MFRTTIIAAALAALCATGARAAVSADEAKQLGTTLTAVGAEKAGNKDGTIPEYTGGLTTPPATYQKGSGIRPDPFAGEKPRLVIDSKNVAQHADKLTEGTKELLKRFPATMRLDVYPTHRVVVLPKKILDNTAKNALAAKSINGGLGIEGSLPGFPFPIPKSGFEAMWNHLMRYTGAATREKYDVYNVDSAGIPTLSTSGDLINEFPLFEAKHLDTVAKETEPFLKLKLAYTAPARRAGEALMAIDSVNPIAAAEARMAVPAGAAAGAGGAGHRLRHAESRHRRRVDLRRRLRVQRRDGPVRLQADRQERDVRPVQRLQAVLRQAVGGARQAESRRP